MHAILALPTVPGHCRWCEYDRSRPVFIPAHLRHQLACGIIFGPVIGVIAHWFKRRLGLALGLIALGSSIGGTIFPIATHNLIDRVG